ncbi:NAD(P)H-dependent oxidoreductase [Dietzia timorensis]|uniref:NAD(P)H dehydrogenase [quinone] 1 n=1 Tax=Dietzia timorensis TaxID=499555 RepID=A0A173LR47_9ACTN|nr:NAD(P)H-dependent oxidoreductase [Dietzia timorensis]ANI93392.1 NAD(P)H dehydrogenase [quinone] 1 [Dietzia timorensis]
MTHRKVLWISAHPSTRSLNHALTSEGIAALRSNGIEVLSSDLYRMGWNPVLDGESYGETVEDFHPTNSVRRAYVENRLPADVRAEQGKIRASDAVVLQFPLWWYGVPAILKGWFDRVLHSGFAFGTDPDTGTRLRFENGPFRGKRALVITTLGDRPQAIGPRGKSGELHELLFGLLHGTLAYTGFDVLDPLAIPSADRLTDDGFREVRDEVESRLWQIFTSTPIPYRPQFAGEYTEQWALADHVLPGQTGLSIHIDHKKAGCLHE